MENASHALINSYPEYLTLGLCVNFDYVLAIIDRDSLKLFHDVLFSNTDAADGV